jgi:hypothetical protein
MHHLGFLADSVDEFHELESALTAAGMSIVQAGQAEDGTLYSYADADKLSGCYLRMVLPGARLGAFYTRTQQEASTEKPCSAACGRSLWKLE